MVTHICILNSSARILLTQVFELMLMVMCCFAAVQAETAGCVTGKISIEDGSALPGVTVILAGPSLPSTCMRSTDADGKYRFEEINPGMYSLRFEADGYQVVTRSNVKIVSGCATHINIVIEKIKPAD